MSDIGDRFEYSKEYVTGEYEYRDVTIKDEELVKTMVKDRVMTETECRKLGINVDEGWVHYCINKYEPSVLIFTRLPLFNHHRNRKYCDNKYLYIQVPLKDNNLPENMGKDRLLTVAQCKEFGLEMYEDDWEHYHTRGTKVLLFRRILISYSDNHFDSECEYIEVTINDKDLQARLVKDHILTADEWRELGVQFSASHWEHYSTDESEPLHFSSDGNCSVILIHIPILNTNIAMLQSWHQILSKKMIKTRLLTADEWRALGIDMPNCWEHYRTDDSEPHTLHFKKSPLFSYLPISNYGTYQCRTVKILKEDIRKNLDKNHIMTEKESKELGIDMPSGWLHYDTLAHHSFRFRYIPFSYSDKHFDGYCEYIEVTINDKNLRAGLIKDHLLTEDEWRELDVDAYESQLYEPQWEHYRTDESEPATLFFRRELFRYSDKYSDDTYEYRHVAIKARHILRTMIKHRLMTEPEWRELGMTMSAGWEHYFIHKPEPHILLFRRECKRMNDHSIAQ